MTSYFLNWLMREWIVGNMEEYKRFKSLSFIVENQQIMTITLKSMQLQYKL